MFFFQIITWVLLKIKKVIFSDFIHQSMKQN